MPKINEVARSYCCRICIANADMIEVAANVAQKCDNGNGLCGQHIKGFLRGVCGRNP